MSGTILRASAMCALVLSAACASAPEPPPTRMPEPARARAALATLVVENQRADRITVSYRIAGRTTPEVGVGAIAPGQTAEMAPVPAGEPLIFIARTGAGAELVLPARTLALDGTWVWRITPADTFTAARSGADR